MNKKLLVLIVDDDRNLNDTLVDILDAKGYETVSAASGTDALKLIKEREFDVIFLDIKMPEMNGVETLKHFKKLSPTTSVVMITAYAEDDLVNRSKEEGALQVLSKPLDIDKIMSFLEKLEILKTIFIIDDDKTFCDSLKDSLEIHGYKVDVVNNPEEAFDTFTIQGCEIILLDMKLNGMNGLDVVKKLKEEDYKSIIILMSAYGKELHPLIDEALKRTARSFIEKPFEIEEIIKIIEGITSERLKEVLAA